MTAGKVDPSVASVLSNSDRTQLVSNLKAALENTTGYSNVVSGTVSNIALNTKLPEQETPNAADTFKEGIVFLEPKRFHPDTGLPFPNDLGNYTDQKYIRLEFIQYLTDSKQFRKLERAWYQSNWTAVAQWGMDYGLTTSGNWVQDNGIAQSKNQATLNGNCIELAHASGIESAVTACFSKIPLAGKKITEFVPEACSQATALGGSAKASCATDVFAEGSYGLNMTTSEGRDYYFVSVPQRTSATDKHENYYCDQATADNIDALVDLMLGNTASDACRVYLWNSFSVKLKTYDKAKGTGTLQWQYWNGSEYVAQESGTFKVITVYNNRVLVIPPSQSYHRDNPGELAGQDFILAKAQGGIYTGTATYANTRKSATFGTSIQGNPKMIDSILNAMGISNKPPYEQAQNVTSAP